MFRIIRTMGEAGKGNAEAFWRVVAFAVSIAVIVAGLLVGRLVERCHLRSLRRREEELKDVETTDLRNPPGFSEAKGPCALVTGEVVVASDAFKTWAFGIRTVFGGESKGFSRIFERARREALLRMKERARQLGCNAICNVRFGNADIGGNAEGYNRRQSSRRGLNMAVAEVSGTAWRRG